MKILLAILTATLFHAAVAGAEITEQDKGATAMLKAVIHVNFGEPDRQEAALGNIENILKEVPTAQIEVVCHGKGINLVVTKQAKHIEKMEALMKQGVMFVACENTMSKKDIGKESLITGVRTVPSGAIEVLRKQQTGYGYFRPERSFYFSQLHRREVAYEGCVVPVMSAARHHVDLHSQDDSPPVWGPRSYNQGAGLAETVPLASWLKVAMPLDDANLTNQEALDVAAYLGWRRPGRWTG